MYNKDPKLKFKNIYSNEIHIYNMYYKTIQLGQGVLILFTLFYAVRTKLKLNELKIFHPNSLYIDTP